LSTDQSVRSSCQPMTSLAYFHDCHCRYDERSMVQKKNARAPLERPPLVFSRRIPCWLGAYFSSPFLMTFIPPIHPRIFSFTSCALRHLLVSLTFCLVDLTTWWRRTTERKLSNSEVAAAVRFTCFTKSWVGQVARALQLTGTR